MSARELRVYGPPGTGKTTHLKNRVAATVRERGVHSIRIASLTKAAAAEIASRVDLPREYVGTLHAHAFHALERPELAETREGLKLWNDRAAKIAASLVIPERSITLDATLDDAGGDMLIPKSEGEGLLQQYAVARARCTPRDLWSTPLLSFAEHWEAFKDATGRLDFTDLIEQAIDEFPHMPGMPTVFLLDEAQDMSRIEMRLARQWGEACEVFVVVGDPFQNLYQWRGSEPEAFDDGDIPADRITVLDQSFRVPRAVHAYAVDWLARTLPGGLTIDYKPRDHDGTVRRSTERYVSPEGLAVELQRDLARGRRVMVLAATGYMLDPLIAILRRAGIPFGNPYKEKNGKLNPLAGVQRLLAFLRPDRKTWADEARPWTWADVLTWAEPLKASEVFERGAKALFEAKCLPTGDLDEGEPGDTPADLNTLFELVKEEHRDSLFDLDVDWYAGHVRKTRIGQLNYGINVARAHGGAALRRAPGSVSHGAAGWRGIIVGTIHSVKGGEADTVYVFPDLSNSGFDGWIAPGWRHDAIARQFYVAFTRARSELVLCESSGGFCVPFDE